MPAKRTDVRVNLWIYVDDAKTGNRMYHVQHIGFFPPSVATVVAQRLDARSIAHAADLAGSVGTVDVMTCPMASTVETMTARYHYEPRRVSLGLEA